MTVEVIACFEALNHGVGMRNFAIRLRILEGIDKPLKLYCDNKSIVLYSNNNKSSYKSNHVDIKFLVVKDKVHIEQIAIEHIRTNSMIVDSLTKTLPPRVFHEHMTAHMGVIMIEDIS